tara:strand:- start:12673 stop:13125 length:453 start_codon:yes stop_codon:yes gene_type:complete
MYLTVEAKMDTKLLKILATDQEDLEVFSAFLQDAIIPLKGLDYCEDDHTFRIFANRFRWELSENKKEKPQRLHTGVVFQDVTKVEYRGFTRYEDQNHSLELLTIQYDEPHIHLIFATDAQIRLTVDKIHARIKDVDDAWPVLHQPKHKTA